jgi:hypothetical protein
MLPKNRAIVFLPWFTLLVSASSCMERSEADDALRVIVQLSAQLRSSCVRVEVTSQGVTKLSRPLVRGTGESLAFALYRGTDLGKQVRLVARGYLSEYGCEGLLTLNEESEPVDAEFVTGKIPEAILSLSEAPFDDDGDGFRASGHGGLDCNDGVSKMHPGRTEDCADGLDNDCNGAADCLDAACNTLACATGICSGNICVTKKVELECENGLDDDSDGATDCIDSDCNSRSCAPSPCNVGTCANFSCGTVQPRICNSPPSECHRPPDGNACHPTQGCVYPVKVGAACNANKGSCSATGACEPLFSYTPSNFTVPLHPDYSAAVDVYCDGAVDSEIDTSLDPGNGSGFVVWCPGVVKPKASLISTPYGTVALFAMRGLTVRTPLRIYGPYPAIFAVHGDVNVQSFIDASANEIRPGPGSVFGGVPAAYSFCDPGVNGTQRGGGGGGGMAMVGGRGGDGDGTNSGGAGGPPETAVEADRKDVRAGCPGGDGAGAMFGLGAGGFPGGGIQISASGMFTLARSGVVTASGGPGQGGLRNGGGGGGGSGGTIRVEARDVLLEGSLTANGGGGGEGGDADETGLPGQAGSSTEVGFAPGGSGGANAGGNGGRGAARTSLPTPGEPGASSGGSGNAGGGGGGGATGRVVFQTVQPCAAKLSNAKISPAATGCQ